MTSPTSASARPPAGFYVDRPDGHRNDMTTRDIGSDVVTTWTHVPAKGTPLLSAPPVQITSTLHTNVPQARESHSHQPLPSLLGSPQLPHPPDPALITSNLGCLPKLSFPKFSDENPRRWRRRCENYFHMYQVDEPLWAVA